MRNDRRTLVALAATILLVASAEVAGATSTTTTSTTTTTAAPSTTSTIPSTTTTVPSNFSCAMSVVSTWTLQQMANETIAIPVNATNIGSMGPAVHQGFGGLLLLGTTAPVSLGAVVARLQTMTPHHYAILVMTDEEGGGVERLTNLVGTFPWAKTMGTNLTPSRITSIAARVGRALFSAGVNVDLAPVSDLDARHVYPDALDPDGLRSFSGLAQVTGPDAVAFETGLAQAGVTSVAKHFPGLGGASRNTDYGPATTKPWPVLQRTALVPFEQAIANGVTAIMMSNASVPGLSSIASSLSPVVVSELRNGLRFQGLILADSLSAGAISAVHLAPPAASVQALIAGVDMVLFSPPSAPLSSLALAQQISSALVSAVAKGTLARATLQIAAAHVVATRNVVACPLRTG